MERSVYILLFLLITTSSSAFYVHVYSSDERRLNSALVIWDVPSREAIAFAFKSDTFQIDLVAAEDAFGRYWKAKSYRSVIQQTVNDSNPKKKTLSKQFVVGLTGRTFLENMLPLRAKKEITNAKNRETEFGFDNVAGEFTITTKALKRTFQVGGIGYGVQVRYIRDENGKIYAMENRLLDALLSADNTFEGKIVFARESEDLISFTIKNRNEPISLRQVRKGNASFWTINSTINKAPASEKTKSWVESKLLTITASGFVPDKERPENLETLLQFEMELRGVEKKISGTFYRQNTTTPRYFLQTDLTRQLVKVKDSQIVDLLSSLETLAD